MRLLSQSGIYLGSSLLSRVVPFLMLPVMTHHLSPTEFGALAIFLLANSCVSAFVGMNVHANISKNFFTLPKDKLGDMIGNIFVVMLVSSFIATVFFAVVAIFVNDLFSLPLSAFLVMPLLSFMTMVNTINLTILRNEGRAYIYGAFEVACTVLAISITLVFLLSLEAGWRSQVYGLLTAYGVFFFVAIVYMTKRGYLSLNISCMEVRRVLGSSVPMIPYVLAGIVMNVSDRVFIERMVGLEAVGHYAIGYNFGMIVLMFTDAFAKAWSPWFYKLMSKPTEVNKKTVVRYSYFYALGVFCLVVAVSVFAYFAIPFMVSQAFLGAASYVFWIALALAIQGLYKMLFPYFILMERHYVLSGILVICALSNLVFSYVLVDHFGAIGAAYSSALAWGCAVVMAFIYKQRICAMPWR